MISPDKLTVKAAEALQGAASEARTRGNAEVHGVHLLHALLDQEQGIVVPILQKLEVPVDLVRSRVLEALDRINHELGTTTLVITHNAAIQKIAHRVLFFKDGKIEQELVNDKRLSPGEVDW